MRVFVSGGGGGGAGCEAFLWLANNENMDPHRYIRLRDEVAFSFPFHHSRLFGDKRR